MVRKLIKELIRLAVMSTIALVTLVAFVAAYLVAEVVTNPLEPLPAPVSYCWFALWCLLCLWMFFRFKFVR